VDRRFLVFVVGIALQLLGSKAYSGAVVEGKVTLLPARNPIVDAARYQLKSGSVAKPDAPSAVVYLEGSFPDASKESPKTLQLNQKNYQFTPALLPILKGTSVEFINNDDDYHQVFSLSKAKRFNVGRYRKEEKPAPILFDELGVVKMYCEIHDHMRATILVLENPFFVKTDFQGNYRLENLPAGKFELKAWLDEKVIRSRSIELQEGKTVHIDFSSE
jgi:plastocyanin